MPTNLPVATPASSPPDLSQSLEGATKFSCAAGSFGVKRIELGNGPSAGVELLLVETDRIRAAICPTRGMSLWKANIDGIPLGWNSAVQGPIHPSLVALEEGSGLGWLDGFDELLVRCGLRSFGAPDFDDQGQLLFPLHGRVGNLPARGLSLNVDEQHSLLEVEAEVHETRFMQFNLKLKARFRFSMGSNEIEIHDTVTNAAATPSTMQMLYHINIGQPVLGPDAKMRIGATRAIARNAHAASGLNSWDTYLPPTPGYEEQVYFFQAAADAQGWATALLADAINERGFAVHYQTATLPYFTQWKNTVGLQDGYVTGLEPGTGFPNPRSFEERKGRLVSLNPEQSVEFQLKIEGVSGTARNEAIAAKIADTAGAPLSTGEFDADWCTPRS